MLKAVVFYGLSALVMMSQAASAAESCDTYSVVPGDTLRLISERYYGSRELSPILYDANSSIIGKNPNTIEIGMELTIPCRDDMHIPQPMAFLAPVNPTPETADTFGPRFFAKAGDTPFISHDNSGIIPDILGAALRAGGYTEALDIARPNGISNVLQVSAEPNALLSFPWAMPNCGDASSLSPQSVYMCNNYTFSDPLYEITLGIFTTADSPLVTAENASSFAGKTICVPQFHTADLLGQNGISEPSTSIVLSPDFRSCLAGLETGTYDAVLADYQSFGAIAPPDRELTDIPAFAQITTLHAVAYSKNPAALEVLKMANSGLKEILLSGEWFGIVNQHLSN